MWNLPTTKKSLTRKLKQAHKLICEAKVQLVHNKEFELASKLRYFERKLKVNRRQKHERTTKNKRTDSR